jgi:hypothetical protein
MKIAAGCVFFNSEDILPLSIENLISHGVVDFYLFDHKSTENVVSNILDKLGNRANIRIIRKDSEPFLQGRMMSLLALNALADGFDVFIPFDADEFIDTNGTDLNLISELKIEFEKNHPAVLISELDYVQNSNVEIFSENDLREIKFSVKVKDVADEDLKEYILKGGTSLARSKSKKAILNLHSVEQNQNFSIAEGSHFINGVNKEDLPVAKNLIIRHLPFRSKNAMQLKAVDGERRDKAGFEKNVGFHSRKLANKSSEFLNGYWLLNSYTENEEGLHFGDNSDLVSLAPDSSFRCVHERILKARVKTAHMKSQKFSSINAIENRVSNKILAMAIDNPIGFPEFENLKSENVYLRDLREHLQTEIEGIRKDHDILAVELNRVLRSTSWKLTKYLRIINKFFSS